MLFWHILAVCRWYFSFHSRFLSMSIVICEMSNLHIFSLRVWKCMTQIRAGRNKGGRGGASSLDFQTFHPRKSSRVHQTTYGFGSTKRHEVLRGGNFENSYKPHVLKWTQWVHQNTWDFRRGTSWFGSIKQHELFGSIKAHEVVKNGQNLVGSIKRHECPLFYPVLCCRVINWFIAYI